MDALVRRVVVTAAVSAALLDAQEGVDVQHYEISASVRHSLVAHVTISLKAAPEFPRKLRLDLAGQMKVESVKARQHELAFEQLKTGSYGGGLEVDLGPVAGRRTVNLTFSVAGNPRNPAGRRRGRFVRTSVGGDFSYIRSQYPWYPRVPDDLATFVVDVTVDEGFKVRTAGKQTAVEPARNDEKRRTWTFSALQPTREIGLVVGRYDTVQIKASGFVLDALVFPKHEDNAKVLLRVANRAFRFYSRQFGKVTASRFTLVEMPAAFGAGSGYGESGYVLIGEGAFAAGGKASWAASLVAHEVAHTWWGQEVRFRHFASESLACYATLKFLESDQGKLAARNERRAAVERIVGAVAAGKTVPIAKIANFGRGIDPVAYRAQAYDNGMMILAMLERAIGEGKVRKMLSELFRKNRHRIIDYATLRAAVAETGKGAFYVETWEDTASLCKLDVEYGTERTDAGFVLRGAVSRQGSPSPVPITVDVMAVCGAKNLRTKVTLGAGAAEFELAVPSEPTDVVLDPDYWLVAVRPGPRVDAKAAISKIIKEVVSNPNLREPTLMRQTILQLEALVPNAPRNYDGLCYTGIGRCQFRLGEFDKARAAFEKALALGAGGPFHRAWIYLRLGNMADVEKNRKEALRNYELAVAQGNYFQSRQAKKYLATPYVK